MCGSLNGLAVRETGEDAKAPRCRDNDVEVLCLAEASPHLGGLGNKMTFADERKNPAWNSW